MNRENETDRSIDELFRDLPRGIQPERDLWPGVSARLAPRREASPSLLRRLREALRLPVIESWHGWAWQAAAAAFCLWLGASFTPGESSQAIPQPSVDAGVSQAIRPVSLHSSEIELLRLKDSLWSTAFARRSELSEDTIVAVENNLHIIETAIRDLRLALENDPGNAKLQDRIVDHHRKEIRILRRLAHGVDSV